MDTSPYTERAFRNAPLRTVSPSTPSRSQRAAFTDTPPVSELGTRSLRRMVADTRAVALEGADVTVDIYGSCSNVCGSIRFTFADRAHLVAQIRLLRRWQRDQIPLTFVSHGSTVVLTNDAALVERAADQSTLD